MKLRLTLDVDYENNGVSSEWLADNLRRMVENAIGNGILTGDSAAEVNTYQVLVRQGSRYLKIKSNTTNI